MARVQTAWFTHQQRRFMRPDADRFVRPDFDRWQAHGQIARLQRKYSADQARAPAGNPDGGQWVGDGGSSDGNVDPVEALAEQILASGASLNYHECLDKCVPLLDRFKLPGSDRNQWDFIRCMNICLGRNK
jgi:hypothetical protein